MDMTSRDAKSQRREEKRREEKRREENGREEKRREEKRMEEKRREEKRMEENGREEDQKEKSQKKEDPGARKGKKVATHSVFPMICGSRGSKSRLAKAAGAEPAGQMRDDKLHAVVARSTFGRENAQNTTCSNHFWKLRCRKSARSGGANTFPSPNVQNTSASEHFFEVEMSKKCAPLWREAHFQVKKCTKHTRSGALFDVQMPFRVAGARDCAPCQK